MNTYRLNVYSLYGQEFAVDAESKDDALRTLRAHLRGSIQPISNRVRAIGDIFEAGEYDLESIDFSENCEA